MAPTRRSCAWARLIACRVALIVACGFSLTGEVAIAEAPKTSADAQTPKALAPAAKTNDAGGEPALSGAVSVSKKRKGGAGPQAGAVSATGHRKLDNGALFLEATENTQVATPFGSIGVTTGSVLLIVATDKILAVYNLHDTRKDAVVITYDKGTVSVTPERVAILAKLSVKSFEEANPAPTVAYHPPTCREVSKDLKLYQADFEISTLLQRFPQISNLLHSDDPTRRKTMSNVLKTGAIMSQLSQSGEPYGYYITPEVRALSAGAHRERK
jgi:hypothetical protein